MSTTGMRMFDTTLQKTNIWLDEIMSEMKWDDREQAFRALRAVLHTLRDHLPLNESAQLAAQLPLLIRGVYFEGWNPNHAQARERHWEQFTTRVSEAYLDDLVAQPGKITKSVLKVLSHHVSAGEINDVKQCLPEDIRSHWLAS